MAQSVLQVTRGKKRPSASDQANELLDLIGVDEPEETRHWLIDSRCFSVCVYGCIFANTLQMGLSKDIYGGEWDRIWLVLEHFFTFAFLVEMLCKLAVLRTTYFADAWNRMDCFLVCLSVVDVWIIPAIVGQSSGLGMLKVLRIARIARVMRVFKELWMILKGIFDSLKPMFWVSMLLLLLLYFCGIVCVTIIMESAEDDFPRVSGTFDEIYDDCEDLEEWNNYQYFGTIFRSMFTMFQVTIGSEWPEHVRPVMEKQPIMVPFFIVFVIFTAFGVTNVLIGVIVDNTMEASKQIHNEAEEAEKQQRLEDLKLIRDAVFALDADQSGAVSLDELQAGYQLPEVQDIIQRVKLPHGFTAEELMLLLDEDMDGELCIHEVMRSFMRLIQGDQFQQNCMLQASLNEAKRQTRTYRDEALQKLEKTKSRLALLERFLAKSLGEAVDDPRPHPSLA